MTSCRSVGLLCYSCSVSGILSDEDLTQYHMNMSPVGSYAPPIAHTIPPTVPPISTYTPPTMPFDHYTPPTMPPVTPPTATPTNRYTPPTMPPTQPPQHTMSEVC